MFATSFRSVSEAGTRAAILMLSFLLCAEAPLALAQTPQEGVSTIRVTTRLVLLDASVVDAKGDPVSGLTASDFQVFEDNKQQQIVSFEAPETHLLPESSQKPDFTLDVSKPAEFGHAPVNVLVLDEMNTHFADSSFAARSLRSYLEHQPAILPQATALFAVNNTHFQLLQNYTADRAALLRSLAAHKVMYAWKLENSKSVGSEVADRLDASLAALEQIAQNLGALSVHKNIVWIGVGFPSIDPQALTNSSYSMLKNAIAHVSDALLDARASLYAIDPTSNAAGMTEITDETQMAFIAAGGDSAVGNSEPFDKKLDFDMLAPLSGGRIVRGLNDVEHQIALSTQLGASFYTLGYKPTDVNEEQHKFRHLRVVCTRPGTKVFSRQGYYSGLPSPTVKARDVVQYDLNNAALAVVPLTGLSVKAVAKGEGFILHVESTGLRWTVGHSEQTAQVQVMAVALSRGQKILDHRLQSMTAHAALNLHPESDKHDAAFEIEFSVPVKTAVLRFVVRDAATGRMGTADVDPKSIQAVAPNDEP